VDAADVLGREILQLLAEHYQQPVDGVALYMFLNTVAGGHYEDRFSQEQIDTALQSLLNDGLISAESETKPPCTPGNDLTHCVFAVTPAGFDALQGR
jgi:hypothetical protein